MAEVIASTPARPESAPWSSTRRATGGRPRLPGADPALPSPGLGRARRRRDLAPVRATLDEVASRLADGRRAAERRRHHQPARDRRGLGPAERPPTAPGHRLAGPPHAPTAARRWTARGLLPLVREQTGLVLDPYFSAHQDAVAARGGRRRRTAGPPRLLGTVDSWVLWNLTGGPDGGALLTDATNASRTMLFDISRPAAGPTSCAIVSASRATALARGAALVRSTSARSRTGVVDGDGLLAGVPVSRHGRATSTPRCSARPASTRG